MYSSSKWVKLVSKLNILTKDGKINWISVRPNYTNENYGVKSTNAFECDYKGSNFTILEYDWRENLSDREVLSRGFSISGTFADSLRPTRSYDNYLLFIKSKNSDDFVQAPKMRNILDLFITVYESIFDLDEVLADLSDDEVVDQAENEEG